MGHQLYGGELVPQISDTSKQYRTKAEEELAAAKLKIAELEDPTKQMALAKLCKIVYGLSLRLTLLGAVWHLNYRLLLLPVCL